jgi:hypothetical protein
MLKDLNTDQARFVALLAKAARAERDAMLGHGPDRTLNEAAETRNPTAALGFDPLPADNTQLKALRDALESLSVEARSELYVLMRVGRANRSQAMAPRSSGCTAAWRHLARRGFDRRPGPARSCVKGYLRGRTRRMRRSGSVFPRPQTRLFGPGSCDQSRPSSSQARRTTRTSSVSCEPPKGTSVFRSSR